MRRRGLPRPIEALLALGGLAATAPLLPVIGAAIKLTSPGPVVFKQQRVGARGKPFMLYKLRTMSRAASAKGPNFTAGDDARITPVGRVLRNTKLDELLTLWNVVRGDLSIVGPRPEVPKYVDTSAPLWREVLEARPGLTSPMAIELRNEEQLLAEVSGDRERYYEDVLLPYKLLGHRDYLSARTWKTDVEVILKTLLAVARSSSVPPPPREQIEARVRAWREHEGKR